MVFSPKLMSSALLFVFVFWTQTSETLAASPDLTNMLLQCTPLVPDKKGETLTCSLELYDQEWQPVTGVSLTNNDVAVHCSCMTPTATPTPTSTDTLTPIPTRSPTSTPSTSLTPTTTRTASRSPTKTPSSSATATRSTSVTPSVSPTPTSSPSTTPSFSSTPTQSLTRSSTPSSTRTVTSTRSSSSTPSVTQSGTRTSTRSRSASSTPSRTSTTTRSATATRSSTATPTYTTSFTPTRTGTRTATPTGTNSRTPTATGTNSKTPSPTATLTRTPTATRTGTATPSVTPTETDTPSKSVKYGAGGGGTVTVPNATQYAVATPVLTQVATKVPTKLATKPRTRTPTRLIVANATLTKAPTVVATTLPTAAPLVNSTTKIATRVPTTAKTVTKAPTKLATRSKTPTPLPKLTVTAAMNSTKNATQTFVFVATRVPTKAPTKQPTFVRTVTRVPTKLATAIPTANLLTSVPTHVRTATPTAAYQPTRLLTPSRIPTAIGTVVLVPRTPTPTPAPAPVPVPVPVPPPGLSTWTPTPVPGPVPAPPGGSQSLCVFTWQLDGPTTAADDASQQPKQKPVLTETDITLDTNHVVGLRYTITGISKSTSIRSAFLTFVASASLSNPASFEFRLDLSGYPFDAQQKNNITARPLSMAKVAWSPDIWIAGKKYDSPDLSSILQEGVDSGLFDAMVIVISASYGSRTFGTAESGTPVKFYMEVVAAPNCDYKILPQALSTNKRLINVTFNGADDIVLNVAKSSYHASTTISSRDTTKCFTKNTIVDVSGIGCVCPPFFGPTAGPCVGNGCTCRHAHLVGMQQLFSQLKGSSWNDQTGWAAIDPLSPELHLCRQGPRVMCHDNRVVFLNLTANNVSGGLPSLTDTLDTVPVMLFEKNPEFKAQVDVILAYPALTYLALSGSGITGTIPDSVPPSLEVLRIYESQLTGTLPTALGVAPMRKLMLHNNELKGALPVAVIANPTLTHLWLQNNQIGGSLPATVGAVPNILEQVRLEQNQFSGAIPDQPYFLSSEYEASRYVSLAGNFWSCPLPSRLSWDDRFLTLCFASLVDFRMLPSSVLATTTPNTQFRLDFSLTAVQDVSLNLAVDLPPSYVGALSLTVSRPRQPSYEGTCCELDCSVPLLPKGDGSGGEWPANVTLTVTASAAGSLPPFEVTTQAPTVSRATQAVPSLRANLWPNITSVEPARGKLLGGTVVTVRGFGFLPSASSREIKYPFTGTLDGWEKMSGSTLLQGNSEFAPGCVGEPSKPFRSVYLPALTPTPTPIPANVRTVSPTRNPTRVPTALPTALSTKLQTASPIAGVTLSQAGNATVTPAVVFRTATPTPPRIATAVPTAVPTRAPTTAPTPRPTRARTQQVTLVPPQPRIPTLSRTLSPININCLWADRLVRNDVLIVESPPFQLGIQGISIKFSLFGGGCHGVTACSLAEIDALRTMAINSNAGPDGFMALALVNVATGERVKIAHNGDGPCRSGWRYARPVNACYRVGSRKATVADARSDCATFGGSLASVHSSAENDWLKLFGPNNAWIDGTTDALGVSTHFDGTPWDFEDNMNRAAGCVSLSKGGWVHVQCSAVRDFLCKTNPLPLQWESWEWTTDDLKEVHGAVVRLQLIDNYYPGAGNVSQWDYIGVDDIQIATGASDLKCKFYSESDISLTGVASAGDVTYLDDKSILCRQPTFSTPLPPPSYLEVALFEELYSSSKVTYEVVGNPSAVDSTWADHGNIHSENFTRIPTVAVFTLDEVGHDLSLVPVEPAVVDCRLESARFTDHNATDFDLIQVEGCGKLNSSFGLHAFDGIVLRSPFSGVYIFTFTYLQQGWVVEQAIEILPAALPSYLAVNSLPSGTTTSEGRLQPDATFHMKDYLDNIVTLTDGWRVLARIVPPNVPLQGSEGRIVHGLVMFSNLQFNGHFDVNYNLIFEAIKFDSYGNITHRLPSIQMPVVRGSCAENGQYGKRGTPNCLPCPTGAKCNASTALVLQSNYWQVPGAYDTEIHPCPLDGVCTGGSAAACAAGHHGTLCSFCDDGYSLIRAKCRKCAAADFLLILMPIVAILAFAVMTAHFLRVEASPADTGSSVDPGLVATICTAAKQYLSYLQVSAAVGLLHSSWHPAVATLFHYQQLFSKFDLTMTALSCFANYSYYQLALFYSLMPLLLGVLAAGCAVFVRSTGRLLYQDVICYVYNGAIVLGYVLYPMAVEQLTKVFACTDVIEGERYITSDLNLACSGGKYGGYVALAVIFLIMLLGVVPGGLLFLLRRERQNLAALNFFAHFGLFYKNYVPAKYYWEVAVFLKKGILSLLLVLLAGTPNYQLAMVLWVLALYTAVMMYVNPHDEPFVLVEGASVLVNIVKLSCGYFYYYNTAEDRWEGAFVLALIFLSEVGVLVGFIASVVNGDGEEFSRRHRSKALASAELGQPLVCATSSSEE